MTILLYKTLILLRFIIPVEHSFIVWEFSDFAQPRIAYSSYLEQEYCDCQIYEATLTIKPERPFGFYRLEILTNN